MSDDLFYPTINFKFKSKIVKTMKGYSWQCFLHVEGPDDVFDRESPMFQTKKECVENLLLRIKPVINEMLDEAGDN